MVVTFEGHSELVSEEMGYSSLRLCSVSQELVPEDSIELNDDEIHDMTQTSTWSLVFNLTVPGWLPESSAFGERDGGTKYALHAVAMIHASDAPSSRAWLSSLCLPFQPQTRIVKAEPVVVPLRRHTAPSPYASTSSTPFPISHYEVSAQPSEIRQDSRFPKDVLSKIRVQMSIPECVSVEDDRIHFSVRLRTKGLPERECKRLRVSDFDIDVEQSEKYR